MPSKEFRRNFFFVSILSLNLFIFVFHSPLNWCCEINSTHSAHSWTSEQYGSFDKNRARGFFFVRNMSSKASTKITIQFNSIRAMLLHSGYCSFFLAIVQLFCSAGNIRVFCVFKPKWPGFISLVLRMCVNLIPQLSTRLNFKQTKKILWCMLDKYISTTITVVAAAAA